MPFNATGYTGGSDEHDTPIEFFSPIADALGGFDIDPCASSTSDLADRNVQKEEDGLSVKWDGNVWVNPPYSDVSDWMERAMKEYQHGNAERVVALVFARTSTQWFHNFVRTADTLCFVEGRLRFGEAENSAPAPSMLVIWGDTPDRLDRVLKDAGMVVPAN
jgi:phage N-6-adenine-methyltransferase